jgi:hypothetical protein
MERANRKTILDVIKEDDNLREELSKEFETYRNELFSYLNETRGPEKKYNKTVVITNHRAFLKKVSERYEIPIGDVRVLNIFYGFGIWS